VSSGRSVAVCRAMKRAYQSAVQNAFSRLLLVVLDNGKVFVDINSTTADDLLHSSTGDAAQILPVFSAFSVEKISNSLNSSLHAVNVLGHSDPRRIVHVMTLFYIANAVTVNNS